MEMNGVGVSGAVLGPLLHPPSSLTLGLRRCPASSGGRRTLPLSPRSVVSVRTECRKSADSRSNSGARTTVRLAPTREDLAVRDSKT